MFTRFQMNTMPVEVMERLIMKSMILLTRSYWETTLQAEVSVYATLSTVCTMWYQIISARFWFRRTLSKRFLSPFTNTNSNQNIFNYIKHVQIACTFINETLIYSNFNYCLLALQRLRSSRL